MTIITKSLFEKKGDKLIVPLFKKDEQQDLENGPESVVVTQGSCYRLSSRPGTLYFLLTITALLVVGLGFCGGSYLYQEYLRVSRDYRTLNSFAAQSGELGTYQGWSTFPLQRELNLEKYDFGDAYNNITEQFEINEINNVESINVPDFRDDRNGRFVHDFNTNMTCIIDSTANRCFVMPLNRKNILPPKSLFDLLRKMWAGYYNINTKTIRKTMRVITPPITDMSNIGVYITKECEGKPVYKLEKYVGGVVKRSADLNKEAKFAYFAGNGLLELDFVNMDDVNNYEKNLL